MNNITFEESLEKIKKLVEKFEKNKLSNFSMDEENTKMQYINPMFDALGWDVGNVAERHYNSLEVLFERKVVIKTKKKNETEGLKAVDYSFRLGGVDKFFVEAKKPSVDIEGGIDSAFQIRRYGWSANLPLNILTDFEEFAIYDCRIIPDKKDSASTARRPIIRYTDYEHKWKEIWDLFSKEAVDMGSLESYKESKKKGTATVDKAFLKSIENWRLLLAKNIALRNSDISEEKLNFAVQKIIDRIIFLRICESRGIEVDETLKDAIDKDNTYANLNAIFKKADEKYNSGLFYFSKEKNREGFIDPITQHLMIDGKVLKSIIEDLYYPNPYEFTVFPADILGNVYEQFLGKVIVHKENSKSASVEDKPEVRKAGGVYYTPAYIVKYIVAHTIGEKTKNRTPKEIDAIKIVDPACGSGSFLIVAYQYLLDWYLEYYLNNDAEKWSKGKAPRLFKSANGLQLTLNERKRILLNNIYGVDLDAQAVEVSKLSLLLKVLEYEGDEVTQQNIFEERVLPDLHDNIKCGNSLVGTDILSGHLDLEISELKNIKPFDWNVEFKEIMSDGGFDCVIGNPPYARIQSLQESQPQALAYYKQEFRAGGGGNFDIYVLFIEQGYKLLQSGGLLGFIQPHKFFNADFGSGIRIFIEEHRALHRVVHFGAEQIFKDATTYTCLLFLSKKINKEFLYIEVNSNPPHEIYDTKKRFMVSHPTQSKSWTFHPKHTQNILDKMNATDISLKDITRKIFTGLQTSADKIYVLPIVEEKEATYLCYSNQLEKEIEIEKGLVKLFLMGKDVKRYQEPAPKNVVIFPYDISGEKPMLMSQKYIKEHFPLGWKYLQENKNFLMEREHGRYKNDWWQFSRPQNLMEFNAVKIMTPEISNSCKLTVDFNADIYHTTKVYSFVFNDDATLHRSYLLGVLNSKMLWFFLSHTGYVLRGGFYTFKTDYLKPFHLPNLNLANSQDKATHDKLVSLVDKMLALQKHYFASNSIQEKPILEKQIQAIDNEIDKLVYGLYGLSQEEIKIIEESVR